MVYVIQVTVTSCEQDQDGTCSWSCSQAVSKPVWHIPLLWVQWKTRDDGQRNCPKHVEFYPKNKFEKLVHTVGFIIRIYHDARSPERQILILNNLKMASFLFVITLQYMCLWRERPRWATASSFTRFLVHTQRRTTVSRTPLDEWSARRRDLYLTTHNTHNRQASMHPVGFEPTFSAGKRPQTYALERAATGTGNTVKPLFTNLIRSWKSFVNRNVRKPKLFSP